MPGRRVLRCADRFHASEGTLANLKHARSMVIGTTGFKQPKECGRRARSESHRHGGEFRKWA